MHQRSLCSTHPLLLVPALHWRQSHCSRQVGAWKLLVRQGWVYGLLLPCACEVCRLVQGLLQGLRGVCNLAAGIIWSVGVSGCSAACMDTAVQHAASVYCLSILYTRMAAIVVTSDVGTEALAGAQWGVQPCCWHHWDHTDQRQQCDLRKHSSDA